MYCFDQGKLQAAKQKLSKRYPNVDQILREELDSTDSHLLFLYEQLLLEQIQDEMRVQLKNRPTKIFFIKQLLREMLELEQKSA